MLKLTKILGFALALCLVCAPLAQGVLAPPVQVSAAITFVGSDFDAEGDAEQITLTWPSVQAGDVAIVTAQAYLDEEEGGWSVSGFTKIAEKNIESGTDISGAIFYKVCTGSESGNLVVRLDDEEGSCSAAVHIYRGCDTSTPLDVTYVEALHYQWTANDATPTLKPITTVTDGALVFVSCVGVNESVATTEMVPPLNYTLRAAFGYPGYNHRWQCLADRVVAIAGVETPGAWLHGTVRDNYCETIGFTIALRPGSPTFAPPPPPPPPFQGSIRQKPRNIK